MLKLQWMINVRKPAFRRPSYSGCQPDTPSSLAAVAARWMGGKVSGRAGMLNFCRAGQLTGIRARMPIRARTAGQVWINLNPPDRAAAGRAVPGSRHLPDDSSARANPALGRPAKAHAEQARRQRPVAAPALWQWLGKKFRATTRPYTYRPQLYSNVSTTATTMTRTFARRPRLGDTAGSSWLRALRFFSFAVGR